MAGFEEIPLTDLKGELASLRIDRDKPARAPGAGRSCCSCPSSWCWASSTRCARARPSARSRSRRRRAAVSSDGRAPSAGIARSSTASGYVVARRKAVVSAKIQGRLSELRVEEGSRVREGEVIARLESDRLRGAGERARRRRAARRGRPRREPAPAARSPTELAKREGAWRRTSSRPRRAACASPRRGSRRPRPTSASRRRSSQNTRDPRARSPASWSRRWPRWARASRPIPPGVNISTSSGAIVALADLDTLEVGGRRGRVQRRQARRAISRPRSRSRRSPTAGTRPCCGR